MKRILQIMSSVSKTSGVANVIMNYYRHIDKNEVQFDFLVMYDAKEGFNDEIETMGGIIYKIPITSSRDIFKYIKQLKAFFKKKADTFFAIQLHELYMNSLIFPIAKRYGINICIAHSHTTIYSENHPIRNRLLFKPLQRTSTYLFACGVEAGEFAFGKHYKDVYIMKNAIDIEKYKFDYDIRNRIRAQYGINENDILIGHIGRFVKVKNHNFIIDIFHELNKKDRNYKLMLIGDGELEKIITQKVKELGIQDNVLFLGRKDNINELLQGMDLFVLPSLAEAFPVVAIEAQVTGLPCFVSDTLPKEIKIENLSFLNLNNKNEWINKIDRLSKIENYRESNLVKFRELGFDINLESEKLIKKYNEL